MGHEEVMEEFERRMPPSRADRVLGLRNGTVAKAIRRGEIEPYRFGSRCWVTPAMLAGWLEGHCRGRGAPGGTGALV